MDKIDILMKEYELMRAEVRIYINRVYLGLTAIGSIVTASLFKMGEKNVSLIFMFLPYAVAVVIGYIAMTSFFVNKLAGYIRLIEERINLHFQSTAKSLCILTQGPVPQDWTRQAIPVLFWENFYADLGITKDERKRHRIVNLFLYSAVNTGGGAVVLLLIGAGCVEARRWQLMGMSGNVTSIIHVIMSCLSIAIAGYFFWYVQTSARKAVIAVNDRILSDDRKC